MNDAGWRNGLKEAAARLLPGTVVQRLALLALVLLAATLRLWNLPHIPYTHDEISALVRVYPSVGETIQKGVVEQDTHPPGVQVFEWAWTRAFGMGSAAVKLPFILLSVAALLLLYRFACAWCGASVALVLTALLATLQYTVMYGQIARPYAFGFFTTALLADQLTRYVATGKRMALAGMVIGAVLSAYTHHFALLLAALMLATGFFLVPAERRKAFLIACAAVAAAYLPNIPIFLRQLGYKGLDQWLAPPGPAWVPDYLWWLAHCSAAMAAVWALLLTTSAVLRMRHRGGSGPVWAIALLWGLLPLAVGYAYSLWRAPVLQYSVVLFSFPYLLLGALAGLRHLRPSLASPVAAAVAVVSMLTLVAARRHYEVFYRSPYEAAAKGIMQAAREQGRLAVVDAPPEKIDFLLRLWQVNPSTTPYLNARGMPLAQVDSLLRAFHGAEVFLGTTTGAAPELPALVQAAFPFLAERHDFEEGQAFLFSGIPVPRRLQDHAWSSLATPDAIEGDGWNVDASVPLWRDTLRGNGPAPRAWDLGGREFGILLEKPVYQLAHGDNDVIEARMDAAGVQGKGLKLVAELRTGETVSIYRSQPFPGITGQGSILCAIPLADLPGHGQGQRLRVYAWNEGGGPAHVTSVEVRVREGNPWLYGLFQPLKGPLKFP